MVRRRINIIPFFFLFLLFLGLCLEKDILFGSSSHFLSIAVNEDKVTLEADGVPLERVLQELGQKTGVRFIYPSSLANDLISISLKDLPLLEAISRILRNYSYLMEGGNVLSVKVLALKASGEVTARPSEARVTTIEGKGSSVSTSREPSRVETRVSPLSQPAPAPKVVEPRPYDLDECHALEYTEEEAAQELSHLSRIFQDESAAPGPGYPRQENPLLKEAREAIEKKLKEAKIKRAQKVLGTDRCSNLWGQAIEELKQFQDERVTATLVEIAEKGKTAIIRASAVRALWHNTADSEFKNMKGIEGLRKLSQSSDPGVSDIARDALRDYERYTKRRK